MSNFTSQTSRLEKLMRFRVREVLLVSSPYDYFTLEEDGQINETLLLEYKQLSLSYAPRITHVSTAQEALEALGPELDQSIKDPSGFTDVRGHLNKFFHGAIPSKNILYKLDSNR